nr:CehA/McbA family metallohydrolase [uncultured Sphingomonas sp.]
MAGPTWSEARKWIDPVHREGGIVSINHPGAPSGEICMGCGWRFGDLPDGAVDSIEVVNGGTMRETRSADGALQGFAAWNSLLNAGHHVTGIGGSDSHEADRPAAEAGSVGSPTTVVYMRDLSVRGFLDGVRAGRVFIDVEGTRDRVLDLVATIDGRRATMGQTLQARAGETILFTASIHGVSEGVVQLVIDGKADAPFRTAFAKGRPASPWLWRTDGRAHWIRAEVRDGDGRLLLIGNPIYFTN